jgi:hypothetical protein
MAHKRKQIRDRLATILTGLPSTGANVFKSHVYPLNAAKLPGLLIYTDEEASEPGAMQRTLDRFLTATVQGYIKPAAGAIDDALDAIAEDVEAAVEDDPKLNGLALFSSLESTTTEFNADGEKPVGIITLKFKIDYRT